MQAKRSIGADCRGHRRLGGPSIRTGKLEVVQATWNVDSDGAAVYGLVAIANRHVFSKRYDPSA
jgi:hypothetical protein